MKRPLLFLIPTLVVLLAAGLPVLKLHMASGGVSALPDGAESKVGYQLLRAQFPGANTNTITVVVEYADGDPLAADRVAALKAFGQSASRVPSVLRVENPAEDPAMAARDVGRTIVVMHALTSDSVQSDGARDLVRALRALPAPPGARVLVTGPTAVDVDTLVLLRQDAPIALAFIVLTTYVLLLVQTGSVILPFKALVMNLLSISASFGAMVWIFQEGNLGQLLDFTGAPIDPSLPVLLFCIVFGLSMDYEVLLLSRMHEEWDRTGDNTTAVASGLEKSGRLITSAAGIMVVVFGSFALAQVTIIKAIGLCLALAILVDATLVRALVVPSAMRLMGRWNWWAPKWVGRLYRMFG